MALQTVFPRFLLKVREEPLWLAAMKIREHIWIFDRCNACGAIRPSWDIGVADTRTCNEREDYQTAFAPEPARRPVACEDQTAIAARLAELYAARTEAMNTETPG